MKEKTSYNCYIFVDKKVKIVIIMTKCVHKVH